ncbi:ABC transporter ATP-binding protein [Aequorivita soesokkakensis]|uniref:ABC transporter ATP-binding protein n=1 Tax=Aequorivita soesokkakensis TaxID=1385699 RepID=A0A1A9LEN0_9FLAO|nr:HAD family phosphatase [Aequorivita soesokkakensis]OAD91730.1 ABC transporter ATP-binding protein [Aequorivita soesokkakensis]
MLKAVLFDMDGVIVDTEPLHRKAYFKMFDDVKIDVSQAMYDSFTGQATLPICRTLCEHFNLSETPEHLVSTKRKHFKYLFENDSDLDLLEGVRELIKDYHANGLTLVLASSASMPNINRIFERFDLNKYFKAKISGADLKASKPHPEIFLKAAELAEEHTDHCMVIEDSTNGIEAAKAANIYCVGFKSPHSVNQDYSKADRVITSFGEIAFSNLTNF